MAIERPSKTFNFDVTGEETGERFVGSFRTKLRLTHREQLLRDQVRRELLGDAAYVREYPDGSTATNVGPDARQRAEILSQLQAHLVEGPAWWQESKGGLDLEDNNVLGELWHLLARVLTDARKEQKERAEAARLELKQPGK